MHGVIRMPVRNLGTEEAMDLHLREDIGFSFTGKDLEKLITPKTKLIYMVH